MDIKEGFVKKTYKGPWNVVCWEKQENFGREMTELDRKQKLLC